MLSSCCFASTWKIGTELCVLTFYYEGLVRTASTCTLCPWCFQFFHLCCRRYWELIYSTTNTMTAIMMIYWSRHHGVYSTSVSLTQRIKARCFCCFCYKEMWLYPSRAYRPAHTPRKGHAGYDCFVSCRLLLHRVFIIFWAYTAGLWCSHKRSVFRLKWKAQFSLTIFISVNWPFNFIFEIKSGPSPTYRECTKEWPGGAETQTGFEYKTPIVGSFSRSGQKRRTDTVRRHAVQPRPSKGTAVWLLAAALCEREDGEEAGKWRCSVSQERFIARGQSAHRTALFQEQSVNPH